MARFINPVPLFHLAKELRRPFVGFDWGDTGFGLCIVDFSGSKPESFPIPLVDSNPRVNYALTPLEMAIRDFRNALKPKGEKPVIEKFDSTKMIPLQVLRPAKMTMFDMASIVNDVATLYDAIGYIFGYSADSRQWKKETAENLAKKVFFQNFLKDLDANGGLTRRLFTIGNEKNSTKHSKPDFAMLHQYSSVDRFLNSFHEFGMVDRWTLERELMKYGIGDPSILQMQLDVLRKARLDCLSAARFTKACVDKAFKGKLYKKCHQRKEMEYLMGLCQNVGYPARDDSFLVQDSEMKSFFSGD